MDNIVYYQTAKITLICLLWIAIVIPCNSQSDKSTIDKYSVTLFRTSLGYSTLGLNDWCDYLKDLKKEMTSEGKNIRRSAIRNWGNVIDLGFMIRTSDHFSIGFDLQYLYSKTFFKYPMDYWLNYFNPIDDALTSLRTKTGIYQVAFSYYIKNTKKSFYPNLTLSAGYGETTAKFNHSWRNFSSEGHGNGFASSASIGFEAGHGYIVYHFRVGYRYFDPDVSYAVYSSALDGNDLPGINLSGIFINVGLAYNVNPRNLNR